MLLTLWCLAARFLPAADLLPLDQVHPGAVGIGRTVLAGHEVEEFQIEVLGVLENVAPGQSLILARFSGASLDKTGVIAGMSGSPVFLGGKLAGAVAYAFPFSTEAIAGIRPIHEMIGSLGEAVESREVEAHGGLAQVVLANGTVGERFVPVESAPDGEFDLISLSPLPVASGGQMLPIATPVALAGFSDTTFEVFAPRLRELGLRPMQGVGGRSQQDAEPSQAGLKPGSMINVALIEGDMELSAAGTVTHVDGDRVYAFGHRFLSSGPTAMPFLAASVIAVVPNLNSSFKISGSGPRLGVITQDRSAGIAGRLGRSAPMVPLDLELQSGAGLDRRYTIRLVRDRFLTPFLLQMAVFSAVDSTERQIGSSSFRLRGRVEFEGGVPPLRLDNMFTGPAGVSLQVATATAVPLAYVLEGGFDNLKPARIQLGIESIDDERRLEINRGWASKTRVRPDEEVELAAALRDARGNEQIRKATFHLPVGTPPGNLQVSFSDANSLNLLEWRSFASPRRATELGQLVRAVNRLRRNDRLYIRVWRSAKTFLLNSERLPSPPASVAGLLSKSGSGTGGVETDWHTTLAEFELDGLDNVVHGSVSIPLTVSE